MKQSYRLGVTTACPLDARTSHSMNPPITKVEKMLPKQTLPTVQKVLHFPACLETVPTSPTAEIPSTLQTPITSLSLSGISQEEWVQKRAKKVFFSRKIEHFRAFFRKIDERIHAFAPSCTRPGRKMNPFQTRYGPLPRQEKTSRKNVTHEKTTGANSHNGLVLTTGAI